MKKLNTESLVELNGGGTLILFTAGNYTYGIGFDRNGIYWGRESMKK